MEWAAVPDVGGEGLPGQKSAKVDFSLIGDFDKRADLRKGPLFVSFNRSVGNPNGLAKLHQRSFGPDRPYFFGQNLSVNAAKTIHWLASLPRQRNSSRQYL